MSAIAQLSEYLAHRQGPCAVLLSGFDAPGAAPPEGRWIAVIASGETLALLPLRGAGGPELRAVREFSGGFSTFPRFARRWTWNAVLQIQLEMLLDALAAEPDGGGSLYLYLHGAFCRKYFPAARPAAAAPAKPSAPAAYRAVNARLDDILAAFGSASLHGISLHATPGNDSYHCYAPHNRLLGIGRGTTEQQMRCGAIFEYCERWVAMTLPAPSVQGSYRSLREQALRPAQVLGLSEEQCQRLVPGFSADRTLHWLPARLEDSGESALVPLPMVNYLLDSSAQFSCYQNSNGCALGNSFAEAALFGALEIIERDALLTTWYSRSAPPRIGLARLPCSETAGLLMLLDAAGYEVRCFDITLDLPVPSVLVLMLGRGPGQLAAFVTAASHPDPALALRTALAEAQSLLGAAERNFARYRQTPAGQRQFRQASQALQYGDRALLHHFDFLRQAAPTLDYAEFIARYPAGPAHPQRAYRRLCEQVGDAGYRLIAVENTPAMLQPLGLASARVFIPATTPMAFGVAQPGVPPQRLQRAARRAGWVRRDADLSSLLPHPLG